MKTALFSRHTALGARMVPFAGWEMPLHYTKGIVQEHQSVRKTAGLFDVSHMGRIGIEGADAEPFLDYLSTNRIQGKADLSTTYTVFANAQGGSVDDLIVYKIDSSHFFIVANAANREKDLAHIQRVAEGFNVGIKEYFHNEGILALQGPLSSKFLPEAASLQPHHFHLIPPLIVAATGYTGAGGYEVFGPSGAITALWDKLMAAGVEPVGLGARDTLRLEMGYALYGHELSENIAPSESVAAWTVKWEKPNFLGKAPLEQLENDLKKRHAYGICLLDKGIARETYPIFQKGQKIGMVTSGTFSPTLQKAVALILVNKPLLLGEFVEVEIREKRVQAEVVKLPFLGKDSF